jgi:hypothetical protein
LIEAAGARLLFLPPYSPDLNPIELIFAKVKQLLRSLACRSRDALWQAMQSVLDKVTPSDAPTATNTVDTRYAWTKDALIGISMVAKWGNSSSTSVRALTTSMRGGIQPPHPPPRRGFRATGR